MKKHILTALTAAVLICIALPSVAQDRGKRILWGNGHRPAATAHHKPAAVRQTQSVKLLKPILALICNAGDCRLKVQKQHRGRHGRHY